MDTATPYRPIAAGGGACDGRPKFADEWRVATMIVRLIGQTDAPTNPEAGNFRTDKSAFDEPGRRFMLDAKPAAPSVLRQPLPLHS